MDQQIDNEASLETRIAPNSVVVGVVVGLSDNGLAMVSFPGCPREEGIIARATIECRSTDIGRQVALLFEGGDVTKPMIIGRIHVPGAEEPEPVPTVEAEVDDELVTLRADRQLVLKCGKASITLTKAGKIILRGAYILNRSSGVNKIKGASVQIN